MFDCEQCLNTRTSRILLTYEKVEANVDDEGLTSESKVHAVRNGFRELYFQPTKPGTIHPKVTDRKIFSFSKFLKKGFHNIFWFWSQSGESYSGEPTLNDTVVKGIVKIEISENLCTLARNLLQSLINWMGKTVCGHSKFLPSKIAFMVKTSNFQTPFSSFDWWDSGEGS